MTRNASKSLGMPEIAVVPLPAPTVLQLRMRAHLVLLCSKYNENLFSTGGHHNGRSLAETPDIKYTRALTTATGDARPVYHFTLAFLAGLVLISHIRGWLRTWPMAHAGALASGPHACAATSTAANASAEDDTTSVTSSTSTA